MPGTTVPNLTVLVALDKANDLILVYDNSAGELKAISPDNYRDFLLSGTALASVDDTTLTASRALVSNASGEIAASSVSSTELGYLAGVTTAIQTQIDNTLKRNILVNANSLLWDLGTSLTPADNDFITPGWRYLTDATANLAASRQSSSPPEGSRYFTRVTGDKFTQVYTGIFQTLRANDSIPLRNKTVSLSFQAKGAGTLKAGIMAWTGTADSVGSDPISAWASTPTLIANWTFENTISSLGSLGASFTKYTVNNIDLDTSSFNNLGVLIWSDAAAGGTATATLDISQIQLELAASATDFSALSENDDRDLASRDDHTFTSAPGTGDDIADGFALGSFVTDVTGNDHYVCIDPAEGSATWKQTTP